MQTLFSKSRKSRDTFCKEKDKILHPILESLSLSKNFRALLMPNLFGHEAFYLVENGVPASNLFAIEDNSVEQHNDSYDVHKEIKLCQHPDRQILKGMKTTEHPEPLSRALDEAYWQSDGQPFDLIYLDFLSQPDYENHYKHGILKILEANMLNLTSTMILTFGRGRSHHDTCEINKQLLQQAKISGLHTNLSLPTEIYLAAAIKQSGHVLPCELFSKSYISKNDNRRTEFITTVAKFCA